jgi:hypothetical protein
LEARRLKVRIAALQARMRAPGRSLAEVGEIHKQVLDLQEELTQVARLF